MNLSDIGKRGIAFCKYFLTETFTKAEIAIYRKIIHLFRYSNSLNFIRYVLRALSYSREDQAIRFQLTLLICESEPFYEQLKLLLFTIIIIIARSNVESGQI